MVDLHQLKDLFWFVCLFFQKYYKLTKKKELKKYTVFKLFCFEMATNVSTIWICNPHHDYFTKNPCWLIKMNYHCTVVVLRGTLENVTHGAYSPSWLVHGFKSYWVVLYDLSHSWAGMPICFYSLPINILIISYWFYSIPPLESLLEKITPIYLEYLPYQWSFLFSQLFRFFQNFIL